MNNIWIACDWHLWSDKKNIHHPYRSISNIGRLADQYTQDIDDTDIFIHLGDLSDIGSTNQEKLESIIKSIPGYKILCKGNHDTESDEFYKMIGFDEVCEICIIHHVVFSHKPVKVPLDMINVHGHLHTEKMSTLGYQHINAYDSNFFERPMLVDDLIDSAAFQSPEEYAGTDLKHVEEKFEKYTSVENDTYTQIVDLTDMVGLYPVDEAVELPTFKTPEELFKWMKSNIHYSNFTKLKSSDSVVESKSGSCHDQVVFEYNALKTMGKKPKILFFIAYREGSNQGGMTHSLVYYSEGNKIKWFENSWSGMEGIHTYDSLSDLKADIKRLYSNMPDAKNFPELEFKSASISDFDTGMNLGEFVSGIMDETANDPLDEVLFSDITDVQYWENDDDAPKKKKVKQSPLDTDNQGVVAESANSQLLNLFFISSEGDLHETEMAPRIPNNYMTENGYEDNKTPRISFSTSIDGCLMGLGKNVSNQVFYVYQPAGKYKVITPTIDQVPDVKITKERWICEPVKLVRVGKIRVTGEKGNGIPYKYGDKNQYTAELYDWKWKWIEKYDNDKTINEMTYEDYADHYLQVLRKAANDLNHDEKVWKHLSKVCNVEIDHLPKFTCKLKFSGEPQLCYDMIEDREQVPFEIRCNMEAYLSDLCRKLEKDRTERKEYPGVTSMFSADGDGLIYINLKRDLESMNEMYLSSLSAYEEDAAQLHTYSKEDKEEVYKKYGIRPVGEYRETDHDNENKDTVESRREKLQEQRKKDLAKARKVKKRKAFVRKVKSHLPGLKNEDTAVDTSDTDQYDEPDVESDRLWGDQIRAFKNKWNNQYPVGLVNSVNESYQFEMLDKVYFHDSINESSEDTKLYPVYVMLMHSGTALANAIKTITKSNFSHASISFDSSMKSMYSFGRKSDTNPFIGAFKKEDITTKFFQNKEIPYALYVVPCTKSEIDAMKKRLNFFIQNSTKFKYDFTGLFKNYFGIADNPEYKWFCSRFVADILNAGRPQNDPYVIEPSLMKPEDFTNTNFATYVTGGMLDTYDKSYVDKRTSFILRLERLRRVKEKALNAQNETAIINLDPFDPLQEAVLEYQLTAMNDSDLDNFIDYLTKFKVRYNKDGNLIITRYDYDQLDRYYRRDLKIMDQAQKDGTVSTVKEKLAELHYIYLILSKYYLTPDLQNNPNTSKDVKQAMFDLRSDLLTKTSQYAKWVSIQDPQFNLMEYYQASKYAKHQIPTKLLTMIDKEIITELQ